LIVWIVSVNCTGNNVLCVYKAKTEKNETDIFEHNHK
jgi:hypothetical protein